MIKHWTFSYLQTTAYKEGRGFSEGAYAKRKALMGKPGRLYSLQSLAARQIKSNDTDSHIFITLKSQEMAFDKFIKDFDLQDYVAYQMPYYVTNNVHPSNGRNLRLTILKSPNHPQRRSN